MKAIELRIGNWYNSIKFNTPIRLQLEDFAEASAHADGSDSLEWFDTHIEPIKLTEQWAEDFGFELDEHRILFSKGGEKEGAFFTCNIMFTAKGYWIIIHRSEGGATKKMNIGHYNFVHQLQNLYFDFAGKELTK